VSLCTLQARAQPAHAKGSGTAQVTGGGRSATCGTSWHERGGRTTAQPFATRILSPGTEVKMDSRYKNSRVRAVSRAATSYWLPAPNSALVDVLRTRACLARSPLTFDRRSSSEHLLGMLVVWPVHFPAYPTGHGEVRRHRSPACGR
jgi:hypothetical protein